MEKEVKNSHIEKEVKKKIEMLKQAKMYSYANFYDNFLRISKRHGFNRTLMAVDLKANYDFDIYFREAVKNIAQIVGLPLKEVIDAKYDKTRF